MQVLLNVNSLDCNLFLLLLKEVADVFKLPDAETEEVVCAGDCIEYQVSGQHKKAWTLDTQAQQEWDESFRAIGHT